MLECLYRQDDTVQAFSEALMTDPIQAYHQGL
jgi:hypothetical protein